LKNVKNYLELDFTGTASVYPEPKDKMNYIKSGLFDYHYTSVVPKRWQFPEDIIANEKL